VRIFCRAQVIGVVVTRAENVLPENDAAFHLVAKTFGADFW